MYMQKRESHTVILTKRDAIRLVPPAVENCCSKTTTNLCDLADFLSLPLYLRMMADSAAPWIQLVPVLNNLQP